MIVYLKYGHLDDIPNKKRIILTVAIVNIWSRDVLRSRRRKWSNTFKDRKKVIRLEKNLPFVLNPPLVSASFEKKNPSLVCRLESGVRVRATFQIFSMGAISGGISSRVFLVDSFGP